MAPRKRKSPSGSRRINDHVNRMLDAIADDPEIPELTRADLSEPDASGRPAREGLLCKIQLGICLITPGHDREWCERQYQACIGGGSA